MTSLTLLIEPGPCYHCPLSIYNSHGYIACLAFAGSSERHDAARNATAHTDGRSCDPYLERPDWCPLVAGEVVVKAAP